LWHEINGDLMADVDVLVVTYNTAALTVAALRRTLESTGTIDIRLLVRDNGSSDGTPQAISSQIPEAEVEAGTENLGFAAGVNRLLERSTAPWVLLLNSDAWPTAGAIARLVAVAEAHPEAAAVAPRLERPDGSLEHSTHRFPSLRSAAISGFAHHWVGRRRGDRYLLEGYWRHDQARPVDWAVGAALLIRRGALEEVGHLDERYFMYAEDLEWCWRATRHGWMIRFEPTAVFVHVGNASGESNYGGLRTGAYLRNTHRFFRSAHGPLASLAYRTVNAAGAARRWAGARVRGDRLAARGWRSQVRVHLEPAGEGDGPPAHPRPTAQAHQ
jgi:GT2 family glycosyltransferase